MFLRGVDDNTEFDALRLDMSDSGWAHFNSGISVGAGTSTFAGRANFTTHLDTSISVISTDGTTGITFSDDSGTGYLYYTGSEDKFYTDGKLAVNGNTLASGMEFQVNGDSKFTGSSRAPIFYDSDDTNYFINPGSADSVVNTGFKINAPDDGGAPAMTAILNMHGYEGRGVGIKMKDSVNSASGSSNREWFVGTGYASSGFNIGYASNGSQSSYSGQAKLAITTGGDTTIYGKITAVKSSTHTAQGSIGATNAHLDLYNSLEANTDQKDLS